MKKSDPEDPTMQLFPESELAIRIGSTGLLSGKLSAADAELGPTQGWWEERLLTPQLTVALCPCLSRQLFLQTLTLCTGSRNSSAAFPTWMSGQGSL